MKIGWIGTGKMGARMSARLIHAGFDVCVYDIIRENTAPAVALGAQSMPGIAELAAASDVLFSMIPDGKALMDVATQATPAMKPGAVLVDMSTIDPKSSEAVAVHMQKAGAQMLIASVSGSLENAEKGTLSIMCSGEKAFYEKALPMFEVLGHKQYYLGEGDKARYMKIAVNMLVAGIAQMLAESLTLGESAGLDWETMIDIISNSAVAAPIIKFKAEALKKRDFSPMGTAGIVVKDMNYAMDIAKEKVLSLPMSALCREYFASVIATGKGELDYASIILLYEEMNGLSDKWI